MSSHGEARVEGGALRVECVGLIRMTPSRLAGGDLSSSDATSQASRPRRTGRVLKGASLAVGGVRTAPRRQLWRH